MTKHFKSLT